MERLGANYDSFSRAYSLSLFMSIWLVSSISPLGNTNDFYIDLMFSKTHLDI